MEQDDRAVHRFRRGGSINMTSDEELAYVVSKLGFLQIRSDICQLGPVRRRSERSNRYSAFDPPSA